MTDTRVKPLMQGQTKSTGRRHTPGEQENFMDGYLRDPSRGAGPVGDLTCELNGQPPLLCSTGASYNRLAASSSRKNR